MEVLSSSYSWDNESRADLLQGKKGEDPYVFLEETEELVKGPWVLYVVSEYCIASASKPQGVPV